MRSTTVLLAVLCARWTLTTTIVLTPFLDRRGLTTPFPLIGLFFFRNLGRQREITRRDTGKIGPLFPAYVISLNVALLLGVIALALWSSGI